MDLQRSDKLMLEGYLANTPPPPARKGGGVKPRPHNAPREGAVQNQSRGAPEQSDCWERRG